MREPAAIAHQRDARGRRVERTPKPRQAKGPQPASLSLRALAGQPGFVARGGVLVDGSLFAGAVDLGVHPGKRSFAVRIGDLTVLLDCGAQPRGHTAIALGSPDSLPYPLLRRLDVGHVTLVSSSPDLL